MHDANPSSAPSRATQPAAVVTGRGGLPKVVLTDADGARAELYLHGAHVTSWAPAGGSEWLFLSERAAFEPRAAIRGGVPVVFPQFAGQGPLPKHGFARTLEWELAEAGSAAGGAAFARLRLRDSAATRALWPHSFLAELSVTVSGASLGVALAVANTGREPFTFTGALHSYFLLDDVRAATVEGLGGVRYRDYTAGGAERVDAESVLTLAGETDRIYFGAPERLRLRDRGRALEIRSAGFPDVVVWNPWTARSAALADMAPDAYLRMLCIEAAVVGTPAMLAPGARWSGEQTLVAP